MSAQIGKIIKGKGKNIKGIIKNMSEIIEIKDVYARFVGDQFVGIRDNLGK